MFDLGFPELLVIGIVALIVVGPKDLPVMFRKAGQFVGKMKGMAREFSTAMNQAADDAGVKDLQKSINAASNPMKTAMDGVKDATNAMTNIDPSSETGKLSAERAEAAKKIQAASARAAADRMQREAQAAMRKADELEEANKPATKEPE